MADFSWTLPAPVPSPAPISPASIDQEVFGTDLFFDEDLRVSAAADYVEVSGAAALRQAIYHRMVTKPGEYRLSPGYGIGVQTYLKRPMTAAILDELRNAILTNLTQESRISTIDEVVLDRLTMAGRPGLRITIRVTSKGRAVRLDPFNISERV